MPHIIAEYPESFIPEKEVDNILRTIHEKVANSGLFEKSHIRTRAYPFKNYTNGVSDKSYIHIQARIKSGRDLAQKRNLSETILQGVSDLALPVSVITVEIIDMDRESYSKHSVN